MQLKIKLLSPDAIIPQYATEGAAAFDVHAINVPEGGVMVSAENPATFSTGLAFEFPAGWAMLVYSRSGHGFNLNGRLANCVAVIDADYRGELMIKLAADLAPYTIKDRERIAQVMLVQAPQVEFVVVDELTSTDRGTGGFGSTGVA